MDARVDEWQTPEVQLRKRLGGVREKLGKKTGGVGAGGASRAGRLGPRAQAGPRARAVGPRARPDLVRRGYCTATVPWDAAPTLPARSVAVTSMK